jgi:hypothetical protein
LVAGITIFTVKVSELPRLLESPEYVTVMVSVPGGSSEKLTEQLPDTRVHWSDGLKTPVELLLENVTYPVGEFPVTVAVQVVLALTANVAGSQTREDVVGAKDSPTTTVKVVELGWLFESPL